MNSISIGVCVYNEENNIKNLLNSLLNQKNVKIKEIIVVSSACTDKTEEIIEKKFADNPKIILIKQEKREGKASAINLLLKHVSGDIVVLESGDTIPVEDTIEHLTKPFKYENIGMTGGKPIPVNNPNTFIGFTVHLLWNLHHKLALKNPKLGELVAFRRRLINNIPNDTAVDEACIEALIKEKGYELVYVPNAIVSNKGPENISDFLKQRRRIFAGHIHLKRTKGYTPSSMKSNVLQLIMKDLELKPKEIMWTFGAMLLEFYGRLLGSYDFFIKNENPYIWNIAETTKSRILETAKTNNPNHAVSLQKQIELWSGIGQSVKSPTLAEASLLSNTSVSTIPQSDILSQSSISINFKLKNNTIEEKNRELEYEKNV